MKRFLAFGVAAIAAISAPAVAQQPPTPRPAATIDPLRISAARQMLEASRVVRNARVGAAIGAEAGFSRHLEQSAIADDAEMVSAVRKTMFEELSRILDELVPKLADDLAVSYAAKMSIRELQEATDFYLSPTGQKLLDLTPAMVSKSSDMMQERIKPYLPRVEEAVTATVRDILAKRKSPTSEQ